MTRFPIRPLVRVALAAAATVVVGASLAHSATAGPHRSWSGVADKLAMVVYRPATTFDYRLAHVFDVPFDPGCENDGREMLRAFYSRQAGAFFEIFEGRPRYCIDTPIDAPVRKHVRIHGKRVPLYELTGSGALVLEWCEKGTTIALKGTGVAARRLIAIARSMRPVDKAPARPCPPPQA